MMELVNLNAETVSVPKLNENVVQIKVEQGAKEVLVQFLKCSACSCEFSDAQHRVAHINVSHPKVMQKEAWTPCSKCHMRFPRKDVLRDHVKRVHQGGKSKCLVCDEMFWTDALFRQHWKKCVAKWVKTAKHEQENSALKEQLIHQLGQQPNSIMVTTKEADLDEENIKQNDISSELKDPLVNNHSATVISGSSPEKKVITSTLHKDLPNEYLCAFCRFIFTTKAGYMEHTKLGQCAQPIQSGGKYKYMSPVPCYYCNAHCASRKALQVHVKEAHSVVKPQSNKEDEENGTNGNFHQEPIPKKQIYSCRSCERKFQDHQEFVHHQQFEHFECDNCYKYFSMENLERHRTENKSDGTKTCNIMCQICGTDPKIVFITGENFVDHMNEKHRSFVGVNWFQCIHCLKLNKRYYNRYYPTQRSLQLHLASMHPQHSQTMITSTTAAANTTTTIPSEIITTAMRHAAETIVPIEGLQTQQVQAENGEIIQQFQIQLTPSDQPQIVEQIPVHSTVQMTTSDGHPTGQAQQFQIVQTDPSKSADQQPQIITLYTWGGN